MEISKTKYDFETRNIDELFKYSFGVTNDPGVPKKIVLSFSAEQGRYVKSLPLHHTQKEIINTIDEYGIELMLHPTYDFIMEMLALGREVRVIEPESLREEIVALLKDTLLKYL